MPNDGSIIDHGDGHPVQRWNPFIGEHGQRDGQDDEPYSTDGPIQYPRNRFNPTSVAEFHLGDDVDTSMISHHHTLGPKRFQGAPGNHQHNGVDSANITQWTEYANSTNLGAKWSCLSGAQPSLGNGLVQGRYVKFGNLCFVTYQLAMGTTTTFGGGPWAFELPFTPKINLNSNNALTGSAMAYMNGPFYTGVPFYSNTPDLVSLVTSGQSSFWNSSAPAAWTAAATYHFQMEFFYETLS